MYSEFVILMVLPAGPKKKKNSCSFVIWARFQVDGNNIVQQNAVPIMLIRQSAVTVAILWLKYVVHKIVIVRKLFCEDLNPILFYRLNRLLWNDKLLTASIFIFYSISLLSLKYITLTYFDITSYFSVWAISYQVYVEDML